MKTALHELFTTRLWNLRYDTVDAFRSAILNNIAHHVAIDGNKVNVGIVSIKSGLVEKTVVSSDPEYDTKVKRITEEDQFITILYAQGPLTRNGDMCSYGSKEHRDLLLWSAKQKNCLGHLFLIDGPGGSSWCKNDYMQGIAAAREAKQPTIALVDGMCASAHQALAVLCDECYYVNPKDEFGCIGTFAAFYTNKDGDIDTVTQERYVEVYATGSTEKNKSFRDAADGDYALIQKEVDEDAEEFKAIVKERRPNVTEEILSGKIITAKEAEGILNDGQSDFDTCIQRIIELHKSLNPAAGDGSAASQANSSQKTPNNNQSMKEYKNIQQACGVEALVSDKDNGLYCTEPMCDALESALAEYKQKEATLEAKLKEIADLNEKIRNLNSEHQTAIDKLNSDHAAAIKAKDDEIANLNSEHQAAIDKLNSDHAAAIKAKDDEIANLNSTVTSLNETIETQKGQIQELSEQVPAAPTPGAAPANEGAPKTDPLSVQNVCKEGMSPEERRAALEQRMKSLK